MLDDLTAPLRAMTEEQWLRLVYHGMSAIALLCLVWYVLRGPSGPCEATRAGRRCVHERGHGGWHRDAVGNYWDQRP